MTTTILKRGLVPLLLAACFGAAVAAPTGQQVVAGQATFSQQGNVFSITNTPGTIINWQSFSINPGEITRFIQQGADSAVLNRIVGQDPSRILGALQSNGKVFLINPNGILFGRDSRVDVNGLVASTLNISNADFLAGKKNFNAGATAGEVRNEGAITTPAGGQVFLVAPNVANAGVITSPKGEVVLAAGHSVQLVDSRDPDLQVVVSAPADQAINLGQVVAHGGRIGIYGALVNQRGTVNADSAVVGENGKIVLKASRDTVLEQGSVTSATGAGKGGEVHLLGERVSLTGNAQVDASGALGGGSVLVGGDWQGKNPLLPNARQTLFGKDASIKADATVNGDGGKVVLWSDLATGAYGSVSAQGGALGGNGGMVETSGHTLSVNGARINAGAAKGQRGKWLLDPYDIEVVAADDSISVGDVADPNLGPLDGVAKISPTVLAATGADVLLQAQHDITITESLDTPWSVTANAGNDINVNATVRSSAGSLMFNAANAFRLGSGATLKGDNQINLIANQMTLDGSMGSATGGTRPLVSLSQRDGTLPIYIGGTGDGLRIDAAALGRISADEVSIGTDGNMGGIVIGADVKPTGGLVLSSSGPITINAPVTVGSNYYFVASILGDNVKPLDVNAAVTTGNIQLSTAGKLSINNTLNVGNEAWMEGNSISGTGTIKAGILTLHSFAGIGASGAPLRTQVDLLDASSDQAGSAPINISNSGNLTLASAFQAGAGNTGSVTVTTTGNLVLPAPGGSETESGGAVGTGSGAIILKSGGSMTIGGSVTSGGGNISLTAAKGMTVSGEVLTAGDITLLADKGSAFTTEAGAMIRTNSGAIKVTAGTASIAPETIGTGPDGSLTVLTGQGTDPRPPSLDQCVANPNSAACSKVIDDAKRSCSTNWNAGHCDDVMPKVDYCKAHPDALGCSAVIKRDAVLQCAADPRGANCGDVLPKFEDCKATPGALGCDAVVQHHGKVEACLANPSASCFQDVLPAFDACSAKPGTFGCDAVIAQGKGIAACIANPTSENCGAVVLPSLPQCQADASIYGCSARLARQKFVACSADATGAGCDSVLPALNVCKVTPGAEGCGAVISKTFNFCLGSPNDAKCVGILPKVSECVNDKTQPGCQAVLPTMNQCIGSPTLQGCSVVLPKLEQCAVNPNQTGCEAVLPNPDFCGSHPQDATCQIFSGGGGNGGNGDAKSDSTKVTQVAQQTVTLVNGSTGKTASHPGAQPGGSGAGGGNNAGSNSNSGSGNDSSTEKPSDKQNGPAAGENSGAKNEKPATKTYCN